jgi:hypothetical protein
MESTDDECTKGFLQGDELKQLGDEMSLADEFMGGWKILREIF